MTDCRKWGLALAFLAGLLVTAGSARPGAGQDDPKKSNTQDKDKGTGKDTEKAKDKEGSKRDAAAPPGWKFDKAFSQTWKTSVEQDVTAPKKGADGKETNETVKVKTELTMAVTWTPEKAATDGGSQALDLTINDATLKTTVSRPTAADEKGAPVELKSSDPSPKTPAGAALAALHGKKLKVTLTPAKPAGRGPEQKPEAADYTVTVTGFDDLFKDMRPEDKKAVGPFLTEAALVRLVEAAFPALPAKEGATASRTGEVTAAFARYKTETKYTLDKLADKKADLTLSSDWKFSAPGPGVGSVRVESVGGADLKLTGKAVFDTDKGQLVEANLACKDVAQKVTLKSGADTITADVRLTCSFSVTAK